MADTQKDATSSGLSTRGAGATVPSPDVIDLAIRINQDRLDRLLSWPAYAKWMGVKQSTLYKIANGSTTKPHALTVARIERRLKEPIPEGGDRGEVVPTGQ